MRVQFPSKPNLIVFTGRCQKVGVQLHPQPKNLVLLPLAGTLLRISIDGCKILTAPLLLGCSYTLANLLTLNTRVQILSIDMISPKMCVQYDQG